MYSYYQGSILLSVLGTTYSMPRCWTLHNSSYIEDSPFILTLETDAKILARVMEVYLSRLCVFWYHVIEVSCWEYRRSRGYQGFDLVI